VSGFGARLAAAVSARASQVVLGLDPDPRRVPGGAGGARAFCRRAIAAAGPACVAAKIQLASFERFGAPGWEAFERVAAAAAEADLLVIADAKRGDVGVTSRAYADAFLRSPIDALTINPSLGGDAVAPFLEAATAGSRGLFALVRTSNPGAAELQDLPLNDNERRQLVNDLLEDEWEWDAAAEKAYEALAIDPTYGRAANALLRCYLTHNALREMQHVLIKLFNPDDEERFNQRHRIAAYSYRVLSRADFWLEWDEDLPPELTDVKEQVEAGHQALRHAYFGGEERDLKAARAQFKAALDRAADRSGLMWHLARLYADKGYFADSAALLGALISILPARSDILRLYAEMLWWRDHSWQIPWIH